MALDNKSVEQLFPEDEYFKKLLLESMDTTQLAISTTLSVSDQLTKLTEGIATVDQEIRRHVLDKHEDLLSQATWIEKLEGVLLMMSSHMQSLLAGVERVRSRVAEPYMKIEKQLLIIKRIWQTVDLLRRISRIQVVSKRLAVQTQSDPNDLTKLSESIKELGELWAERDLSSIEVLEQEKQNLKNGRREVGKKAKIQLINGLQSQKSTLITQSIEVLFNLDSLTSVVDELTQTAITNLDQVMKDNLDTKKLVDFIDDNQKNNKISTPTPGSSLLYRQRLWSSLEKVFDAIYTQCIQIEALEIALRKPRIEIYGSKIDLCIDIFPSSKKNVSREFWLSVTNNLSKYLNNIAKDSIFLKQALEGEYPHFLSLYIKLCKRLQLTEKPDSFTTPFEMNKRVISAFEKSYLSKSVSMVVDPVHNMFSKDGVPSIDEVDQLISTIRSELIVALFDPNLSSTIARNIANAVRQFCSKCKDIVDKSPDATQIIGPHLAVQEHNIAIANITEYLKCKLQSVMTNLNAENDAVMIVSLSLVDADNLIAAILNPVLKAVEKAIHAILLTMHHEDFSKETVPTKISPSLYMQELETFISRSFETYLRPFESEDVVKQCARATGQRCVQLFMRYASIIRPMGAHGRAKLCVDCSQLEAAVGPLLGDEPKTYRILRSFRTILNQSPQEILTNPAVGETLPVSTVLFYLFSFAPEVMRSPHQSGVNWTAEGLSDWLDAHESERDRLGLVSGAIGRYCNIIRQQPDRNFHPVYAVMAQLIEKIGER